MWLRILVTVLFSAFLVIGTIAAVPVMFEAGGWTLVGGNAAWSIFMAYVFVERARRAPSDKNAIRAIITLMIILFSIFLVPAPVAAIIYGNDAASGAVFLSFFVGILALQVGLRSMSRIDSVESRQRELLYELFRTKGPVGRWGSIDRDDFTRFSPDCRIVFENGGTGSFQKWIRGCPKEMQFCWRLVKTQTPYRGLIELRPTINSNSYRLVEYIAAPYGDGPHMFLVEPGALDEEPQGGNVDRIRAPIKRTVFWPEPCAFRYMTG